MVKGIGVFLEAMCELVDRGHRIVCLLPGFESGKLSSRERELVEKLEKGGQVLHCGFVRDIERWISASDVVYALHIEPHFSRTIMEAGTMGRPVIASDIAGIREVVIDGKTGILCPPGDAEAVVDATIKLWGDASLRAEIGGFGKKHARSLFDSRSHATKVSGVYRDILKS